MTIVKSAIIVPLLLMSVLFQSFGSLFVIGNYYLNKDFIAKNLCENKKKPVLKCEGKCHLSKELKKQESKEKGTSSGPKVKFESPLFCQLFTKFTLINSSLLLTMVPMEEDLAIRTGISVFHPPRI